MTGNFKGRISDIYQPENGSLTTEFTEIKDIIRAHRVFLSNHFGYYSVLCFLLIIMVFSLCSRLEAPTVGCG